MRAVSAVTIRRRPIFASDFTQAQPCKLLLAWGSSLHCCCSYQQMGRCCVAYGCIWLLPLLGHKHSHTSTCLNGSHPFVDPELYILLLQLPADGQCCVAHGCICFGPLPGSGCLRGSPHLCGRGSCARARPGLSTGDLLPTLEWRRALLLLSCSLSFLPAD